MLFCPTRPAALRAPSAACWGCMNGIGTPYVDEVMLALLLPYVSGRTMV